MAIRPASASKNGKAREIWRMEETMPHIPSPLLSENRLYMWADNGVITCLRPKTGEKVWKARVENVKDTFFGSPVLAGDTVFCVSAYGQVVAIADRDEFKQLGVTEIGEVCRSTPALANGDLYLRTAEVTEIGEGCRSTPALANGDLYLRTAERLVCVKGF